ncbi:IclR family transcriptional regulator C-terminal domain-containing protein [Nocardia sp. NPDC058499]|uniref:IclR family transcriptional regulator domain-containing protein n=1 Tax=Nocardia sp. NPDC058499 TaxID=3346530 RepID=UPI00365A6204
MGGRRASRLLTRIGGRLLAPRSALGQALLAAGGRTAPDDERVRELGYAIERNGALPGLGCIAAPIGPGGETTTAVSISAPMSTMTFDAGTTALVKLAAHAIWRSMSLGVRVIPTLQRRNILRSLPTARSVLADG